MVFVDIRSVWQRSSKKQECEVWFRTHLENITIQEQHTRTHTHTLQSCIEIRQIIDTDHHTQHEASAWGHKQIPTCLMRDEIWKSLFLPWDHYDLDIQSHKGTKHTHTLLKLRKPGWEKQLKQTSVISWGSKWEKMTDTHTLTH